MEVDQEAERASCSHQRDSSSKPPSLSSFHTTAQQPNDPAFKRTASSTQNIPNTSLWAFQPPTVPPLYREHGAGEGIGLDNVWGLHKSATSRPQLFQKGEWERPLGGLLKGNLAQKR